MKAFLLSAVFFAATIFATELPEDSTSSTMVGVLMDANCPAIRAESAQLTASARKTPVKRTATRNRSADSGDKYMACKATPDTTDFAIQTFVKVFVLDGAGNEVVRQQMQNESFRATMLNDDGTPRWLTVTVEGRRVGEKLNVVSLRR